MTAIAIEAGLRPRVPVSEQQPQKNTIGEWPLRRSLNSVVEGVRNVLFATVGPNAEIRKIQQKVEEGKPLTPKEQKKLNKWNEEQDRKKDKMQARGGNGSLAGRKK